MQIHCSYVLRGEKTPFIYKMSWVFFSSCININSRVSQQFSSCLSCVYGLNAVLFKLGSTARLSPTIAIDCLSHLVSSALMDQAARYPATFL